LLCIAATSTAHADCGANDYHSWRFGGRAFYSDAADLCTRGASAGAVLQERGITYTLGVLDTEMCTIVVKERPVRAGERLPFGVTTTDTPRGAFEKIEARGAAAAYGVSGTDPTPVSVEVTCGPIETGNYDLAFEFGRNGRMTGIQETLFLGRRDG